MQNDIGEIKPFPHASPGVIRFGAMRDAAGDPDRDGLSNQLEWAEGSDPQVKNTIAGALTCELWLSSSDSKFDKRLFVRPTLNTSTFDTDLSQKSAPVALVAGRRYYTISHVFLVK